VTLRWQDTPLMVEGDRELLAQALGNLLDNAIDFTPSAGRSCLGRKSVMAACC
jgi:two-component system sensor histidine kinase CreC